jgi:uncharacterized protein
MFLQIRQLQIGRVRFSETLPPGAVEFFDQQIRQSAPIVATGSADLSEALMEIRVRGHLTTRMEVACDRCLEPTGFDIDADFDLLYRASQFEPAKDEVAIAGEETEVGFYEGDGLELNDVLREQVLLSLPMQRICDEACKGICPVCGQNRNTAACDCHAEQRDDRWAGLRNL